jgi:HK97 gp10 family phage protein
LGSLRFELKGLDKLQAKLQRVAKMEEVEHIVEENGKAMLEKAIKNTEKFRGHYRGKKLIKPTGATKRSLSENSSKLEKFKYRVAPGTDYAAYVELGTRKMSAQPFIKPAFDDQKKLFKNDLERLVK